MTAYLAIVAFSISQPLAVPPEVSEQMLAGWIADLTSKDQKAQLAARDALVKAGPKAKAYVPQLLEILGEKPDLTKWSTFYQRSATGLESLDFLP